jgi:riboflavin kinase/FMN adenylyltransferase
MKCLGYHYPVSGTVVHGKKIGRTIGYPTANIDVDPIKLLPKNGAYIVDVELNGQIQRNVEHRYKSYGKRN